MVHIPTTLPLSANPAFVAERSGLLIERAVFGRRQFFAPELLYQTSVPGGGTIDGAGAAGFIAQWSDSDTLTDSIMQETPGGGIAVGAYDADLDPNNTPLFVQDRIVVVRAAAGGIIDLGRANDTFASPDVIANGDSIGTVQFNGWDGVSMVRGAFISVNAEENWDASGRGCGILFRTTPINSTTQTQAFTITSEQKIVYTPNPFTLQADTSDAADTKKLSLCGGGAESTSRGALVLVHGNEHASTPGNLHLFAGLTGAVRIRGHVIFDVDATYDIGAAGATRPRVVYASSQIVAPIFDAASGYRVAGATVVQGQKTGWGAVGGTASRTAFTIYATQAISNPPTQAQVTNINNGLVALAQRFKALKDDIDDHGLIGP